MKIYTGRGDKGKTSLFSGERLDKDAQRIEAYGTFDELNCVLSLAFGQCRDPQVKDTIAQLQLDLFRAASDLATRTGKAVERLEKEDWKRLEATIDRLQQALPPLRNFILPGGTSGSSWLHFARAVCRRAERLAFRTAREEGDVNPELLVYTNRLSDLLFVLARLENQSAGVADQLWKGRK
jgi:cob(I)alamin adenosyltransferase